MYVVVKVLFDFRNRNLQLLVLQIVSLSMLLVMFASPPRALRCAAVVVGGAVPLVHAPSPRCMRGSCARRGRPCSRSTQSCMSCLPTWSTASRPPSRTVFIFGPSSTLSTPPTPSTLARHFDTSTLDTLDTSTRSEHLVCQDGLRHSADTPRHLDTGVNRHTLDTHSTLTRHSLDTPLTPSTPSTPRHTRAQFPKFV